MARNVDDMAFMVGCVRAIGPSGSLTSRAWGRLQRPAASLARRAQTNEDDAAKERRAEGLVGHIEVEIRYDTGVPVAAKAFFELGGMVTAGVMSDSPSRIRLLAVDDHPVVREGIAGLVGIQADMTMVGEASNGRDAIQQFRTHRPDVTLMDLQMPEMNGIDALIAIRNEFPDARVIVLTTYAGDVQILRAMKAGAQAYLLKSTLHQELITCIRAVHGGKRSLSPEVSFQIAQHMSDDTLTPAEIQVLRLIAAGNANKQIADQLGVTEDTIKGRVKSLLAKLGANDRTHAAIIALKRGIIDL